jgi:hypothetical protein
MLCVKNIFAVRSPCNWKLRWAVVPCSNGPKCERGVGNMTAKLQAKLTAVEMFLYFAARYQVGGHKHRIANILRTTQSDCLLLTSSGWGNNTYSYLLHSCLPPPLRPVPQRGEACVLWSPGELS